MSASHALAPILEHIRTKPSRTWSLIVTLFGDAVLPRGGRLWLGTLLDVFAALEIGGNVVRTATSRLASDGWLERTRVGRNSYYRLAEKGRVTFAEAAARIYGAHPPSWDGIFRMAVVPAEAAPGYALLAPGVFVGLGGAALPAGAIALRAETDPQSAKRLASQLWPTERLSDGYRAFLAAFAPLGEDLPGLSDLDSLIARLLLIHDYRRLLLRDPMLPDALLPENWPGNAARALCARLYKALLPASERWLDANALNEDGALPPPDRSLHERFSCYELS